MTRLDNGTDPHEPNSRTEQRVEALLSEFEIEPDREGGSALDISFNDTDEDETGL
jgi:hypothetical protein